LLIGLEESGAWETKEQTKEILDKFSENALHLTRIEISLVVYHWLPQRPIDRNRNKVSRPIINKVPTILEKVY